LLVLLEIYHAITPMWLEKSERILQAAQHDETLLHKLQRHVQTQLDGSAGSWRRNTQAQALWTLATFIATGLSQGQTLQDVIEPLITAFI
jgi:hypothetical protein